MSLALTHTNVRFSSLLISFPNSPICMHVTSAQLRLCVVSMKTNFDAALAGLHPLRPCPFASLKRAALQGRTPRGGHCARGQGNKAPVETERKHTPRQGGGRARVPWKVVQRDRLSGGGHGRTDRVGLFRNLGKFQVQMHRLHRAPRGQFDLQRPDLRGLY